MQNLIVGKSGSGKGYEVCAFHILSALSQGRKVITNMPLVLEKWGAIDPSFPALIEMRKRAMPIRGTFVALGNRLERRAPITFSLMILKSSFLRLLPAFLLAYGTITRHGATLKPALALCSL